MEIFTLDFETYFSKKLKYSLSSLTNDTYVRDPRFEVIGVGVRDPSGQVFWLEEKEFAVLVKVVDWSKYGVLAHHTHFDGLILSHKYGVKPAMWLDTLSMSRPYNVEARIGNKLGDLAKLFDLGFKDVQQLVKADGKRRKDFSQAEWLAFGEYCQSDVDICWKLFCKWVDLGFPWFEMRLIDSTIRWFTEPTFIANRPLLEQALKEEKTRKRDLLIQIAKENCPDLNEDQLVQEARSIIMSNDKFALELMKLGVEPPMKPTTRKNKKTGELEEHETYAFAQNDAEFQNLHENHPNDKVRLLVDVRLGTKSTITQTRTQRFLDSSAGGRPLCVYNKYWGGHTGRWSGADMKNFQNMNRGGVLRDSLEAPPGCELVVVDSQQIEARKLAYVAGQQDVLDVFRKYDRKEGLDPYSAQATEIYGRPVDGKKNPEDKTPRFVGKTTRLGLGYAMGFLKFGSQMSVGMLGGDPVIFGEDMLDTLGVDLVAFLTRKYMKRDMEDVIAEVPSRLALDERIIHFAVADAIVRKFRSSNTNITDFWKVCDDLIECMDVGEEVTFENLLRTEKNALVALPTGTALTYPELRHSSEGDGYSYYNKAERKRTKLYGGKLTENIVQKLARDIVAEQLLKIEDAGHKTVSTTHDEVIVVTSKGQGARVLDECIKIMSTAPTWAPGLPISAEGGYGKVYGKIKP